MPVAPIITISPTGNLESSTIPRLDSDVDNVADWSDATTYAINDKAVDGYKIYKSCKANNTNNQPSLNTTGEDPWWAEDDDVNMMRMFNNKISGSSSTAINAGSEAEIEVVIAHNRVSKVLFSGLDADEVVLSHLDSDDSVMNTTTYNLYEETWRPTTYMEYFFSPAPVAATTLLVDLQHPTYGGQKIKAEIKKDEQVSVGSMNIGFGYNIGTTLWKPRTGLVDFVDVETDDDGRKSISKRKGSRTIQATAWLKFGMVDQVHYQLEQISGELAIWDLNTENTSQDTVVMLGWFRNFYVIQDSKNKIRVALEIEQAT